MCYLKSIVKIVTYFVPHLTFTEGDPVWTLDERTEHLMSKKKKKNVAIT